MNQKRPNQKSTGKWINRIIFSLIAIILFCTISVLLFGSFMYKVLDKGNLIGDFDQDVIPFTYSSSGHILVNLQFDNDSTVYPFILDSGNSNMLFDNFPNQKRFQFSFFSFSIDAGGNFAFHSILKTNKIKMGKVKFSGLRFATAHFDWPCYDHIYGILGKEAMRHLAWQIDFEKQQIIVSDRINNLTISPDAYRIKLSENKFSHHLYLSLHTPDKFSKGFVFDTGNSGSLSIQTGNEKFDGAISDSIRVIGSLSRGLTGRSKAEEWIVKYNSLFLGDSLQLKNVWADRSASGLDLFGLEVLNRFKVTFDWKEKNLYLEPKKELLNFEDNTLGFSKDYKNGKTFVSSVVENSGAYRSGVRPGQTILSINNLEFKTEEDFCNSDFSKADSVNLVVVKNDGNKLSVTCQREFFGNLKKKE